MSEIKNLNSSRPCDLCHHAMVDYWQVQDALGHAWKYVCCKNCALVRLELDEQKDLWHRLAYPLEYYGDSSSKFGGAIQWLREISAYVRARRIHRFFSKPGRILDIGCGEGLFLQCMKKLGWHVTGCEISEIAADRAEKRLGQRIHRADFESMEKENIPWDVIMLWQVLEHVPNPNHLLQEVSKHLKDDGLIVIAVPNATSWQARLFGPNWFHLDPPRHLYHMGLPHLHQLAAKVGFRVTQIHHFSLEYNPFGYAQSLLNALGFKRDAMYQKLKRRSDSAPEYSLFRFLAWFLLVPSIFPAIIEAAAGQGGTVAAYLRKAK